MKNPKVSVILAVKNGDLFLKDAIKSILVQTFKNYEFLIIDDNSIDKTPEILKSFKDPRIKIFTNQKHLGLTKSLNIALKKAKGEFIARMDTDDVSKPERLKTELEFLEKNPKIALVGSWVDLINSQGQKLSTKKLPIKYSEIKKNLIKANQFYHPTLMIRKNVLKTIGFYDEKYQYSQDYELVLRIASKYTVANIPKPLLYYRVNSKGSISYDQVKKQAYYALLCRLKALSEYGYPKWQAIYIIKPLVSFLIPKSIILLIYKVFYFKKCPK